MHQKISEVLWAPVRHDRKIKELIRSFTSSGSKDGEGTIQLILKTIGNRKGDCA